LDNSPSDRLLELMKRRGPQSAAALAAASGVTHEAVRQQLLRLAESGQIAARAERRGVGRPLQVWSLTEAGHGRFPDAHAQLTVKLIETIRAELGEAALDRIIGAREAETRDLYAAALHGLGELGDRVAALARLRTAEGYMAEAREIEGGFLLIEHHCPICAAATACQGFCRAEIEIFRAVLGDGARIERTEHVPSGAERCAYRITLEDGPNELDRRAGAE
jgi:predicted ArsR family transcriptional regulator